MNKSLFGKYILIFGGISSLVTTSAIYYFKIKYNNNILYLESKNKFLYNTIEKLQYENKKLNNKLKLLADIENNNLKISYNKLNDNLNSINDDEDSLFKSDSSDSFEEIYQNKDESSSSSVELSIETSSNDL